MLNYIGIYRSRDKKLYDNKIVGAGAKKVSEGAGVTLAKGKELLNKVYTAFPKLMPYFIEQGNLTRERGYVVTNMVSKRRSYIPFYKEYLAAKAHVEYFKSRG